MKINSFWRCRRCETKIAKWIYMPDDGQDETLILCDDCVPRGCICNGPDEPCCEWWEIDKDVMENNPDGWSE